MRIKHKSILLMTLVLLLPTIAFSFGGTKARINVKVVDENYKPVTSAKVSVGFETGQAIGQKVNSVTGTTNESGMFLATSVSVNRLGFTVEKQGFYRSIHELKFDRRNNGRWEPWGKEIIVVLRRIENPLPMYARDTNFSTIEIPVVNEKVGFDLLKFDWVAPYGEGEKPDFIFLLNSYSFFTLIITILRRFIK